MNNFEKMFSQAVHILLEERGDTSTTPQRSATQMVQWKPGPGRWGQIIKGLKEDADVEYDVAVSRSSAGSGKSRSLMARLQVVNASTSDKPAEAAAQILNQAFRAPAMAAVFGGPSGSPTAVNVSIKVSTKDEDIKSGEGISARNAAAFIHLTLVGAYNAGMLKIEKPVKISSVSKNDKSITIIAA